MPITPRCFEKFAGFVRTQESNLRAAGFDGPLTFGRAESRRRRVAIKNLPLNCELKRASEHGLAHTQSSDHPARDRAATSTIDRHRAVLGSAG
jgi:hypothetical protein